MSQTHVLWVTDAPTISSHGIYIALPKRISKCLFSECLELREIRHSSISFYLVKKKNQWHGQQMNNWYSWK